MSAKKANKHEFQAEVKQLLDIVINSLYTDKEIFIRELVSNASDALEKLRYILLTEKSIADDKLPMEIELRTDDKENTITFIDYGVGMNREELIENLGTIAHSGSKQFLETLKKGESINNSLIGQFGVGFYSVFMVAEKVEVFTRSFNKDGEDLLWVSDGAGTYSIENVEGNRRGTKIVVHLKEEDKSFSNADAVKHILNKYSSFVQFPIKLNGEQINTVEAIWLRDKSKVKDEEYNEFYKFQANAFDEPTYRLHFSSDAPIDINSLLYVPGNNPEVLGLGRIDPGVSLYCKKILIDPKPKDFLPDWLRFLRGVVDSADLPLNISRETMQDSSLMHNLGRAITKRFLRFLEDEARKNSDSYNEFFKNFGFFIKEGASSDFANREQLQKLLRFESSKTEDGKMTSFVDYVSRMAEGQDEIYYISGVGRDAIESGPHMEIFKANDIEVVYVYEPIDDFVMSNTGEFDGKKIVSADNADLKLDKIKTDKKLKRLSAKDAQSLCDWLKLNLGAKVEDVTVSNRLVESPAVALNSDQMMTNSMRKIMKAMKQDENIDLKVKLEINSANNLIKNLNELKDKDSDLAKLIAEQIYDNALLAAGFMDNPRNMVGRIYNILEQVTSK